jgi:two-component system chemotaxis response regulator CheY
MIFTRVLQAHNPTRRRWEKDIHIGARIDGFNGSSRRRAAGKKRLFRTGGLVSGFVSDAIESGGIGIGRRAALNPATIRIRGFSPKVGREYMPKILIADDGEFLRVRTARMLAVEGFGVLEAENGIKAVELFTNEKPDAVLLDLVMPEKDGVTALKEILAVNPRAKVIMLASPGQETMVLEAIRAGAKDYLVKPFERERAVGAIRKILGLL